MGIKTMQSGKKRRIIAKINPSKGKNRLISKDNFWIAVVLNFFPGMIYIYIYMIYIGAKYYMSIYTFLARTPHIIDSFVSSLLGNGYLSSQLSLFLCIFLSLFTFTTYAPSALFSSSLFLLLTLTKYN